LKYGQYLNFFSQDFLYLAEHGMEVAADKKYMK